MVWRGDSTRDRAFEPRICARWLDQNVQDMAVTCDHKNIRQLGVQVRVPFTACVLASELTMISCVEIRLRLIGELLVHVRLGDHERAEWVVVEIHTRTVLVVVRFGVGVRECRVGVIR